LKRIAYRARGKSSCSEFRDIHAPRHAKRVSCG
jgi:hypothetical protein